MIVAHVGLDGSGKSYGMAQDAKLAMARERKKKHPKEIWSILPMSGSKKIHHPHQILFLENSIIFLDEIQRFYPADNQPPDEIMQHIISTHRHQKNTIHWASQDWTFVNSWIRRETAYCWQYEAIHRDKLTGESRWFGTSLHRHKREMISGVHAERGYKRPHIFATQKFWVTKKGCALFDSYADVEVVLGDPKSQEYLATLVDPHYLPENLPPESLPDENAEPPG